MASDEEVKKGQIVEARARNISHNVRCTECGSQSIEDSQADVAILLRKVMVWVFLEFVCQVVVISLGIKLLVVVDEFIDETVVIKYIHQMFLVSINSNVHWEIIIVLHLIDEMVVLEIYWRLLAQDCLESLLYWCYPLPCILCIKSHGIWGSFWITKLSKCLACSLDISYFSDWNASCFCSFKYFVRVHFLQ